MQITTSYSEPSTQADLDPDPQKNYGSVIWIRIRKDILGVPDPHKNLCVSETLK